MRRSVRPGTDYKDQICFKIEPTTRRSSFADLNALRGSSPRHAPVGSRGTFGGLSPLHVRSERSPLHDVRQHAHANDARTRRIACANLFSRTSSWRVGID